jgi:hypothetical protein
MRVVPLMVAHGASDEKSVIQRLRETGALQRDTARPLPDMPRRHRRHVERLKERGIIREAGPGAFYLDEEALHDLRGQQRTIALSVMIALAGLGIALLLLT